MWLLVSVRTVHEYIPIYRNIGLSAVSIAGRLGGILSPFVLVSLCDWVVVWNVHVMYHNIYHTLSDLSTHMILLCVTQFEKNARPIIDPISLQPSVPSWEVCILWVEMSKKHGRPIQCIINYHLINQQWTNFWLHLLLKIG